MSDNSEKSYWEKKNVRIKRELFEKSLELEKKDAEIAELSGRLKVLEEEKRTLLERDNTLCELANISSSDLDCFIKAKTRMLEILGFANCESIIRKLKI